MKRSAELFSALAVVPSTGCAGPIGPPLGLGPEWDGVAGVALLLLIAAFAYRPVRKLFSGSPQMRHNLAPKEIVKERYARGEIDHEQYERMMQHLS
jgi:Short C-terminal domain